MASLASFDRKKGADRPGIAGVDEAGRGSLCGPVIAAAVLLDAGFYGEPAWLRKLSGAAAAAARRSWYMLGGSRGAGMMQGTSSMSGPER